MSATFARALSLCSFASYVTAHAAPTKPHLLLVLADDLGFANVGWNRKDAGVESKEIQTPVMDQLVAEGVQLTRFYAYKMCSPTRSALQTGRLAMHVNHANSNPTIYNPDIGGGTGAGIPRNMTGIASQLRKAGYRTHMAGKWDAGMATPTHTPHGRGYETGLSYFHHANNMWTEEVADKDWPKACGPHQDLYDTFGPAHGIAHDQTQKEDHRNISGYEEYIFSQRLISKIKAHDPSEPLFIFYSSRLAHVSYNVPDQYLDKLAPFVDNSTKQGDNRLKYSAMVNFLDDSIGNITAALKAKGMWDNTLMLFFADNGGPIYLSGNNYPLRGGKYSDFEGGVRVAAFASGGALSKKVRGTRHNGIASYADVYTTFCGLAGTDSVDHAAAAAGLPPVDGLDLSKMLLSGAASPRDEMPLSPLKPKDITHWNEYKNKTGPEPIIQTQAAIVVGDLKLIVGEVKMVMWTGPVYPNASSPSKIPSFVCSKKGKIGCLFNITADPTEHNDLVHERPDDANRLLDRLVKVSATMFNPDRGTVQKAACDQVQKNGGFFGPWLELPSELEKPLLIV